MPYTRLFMHRGSTRPPQCSKVSGNVKLGGVNQQNAIVDCIDENDKSFVGQILTDSSGNYSFGSGFAIHDDHTYHVTAQYDSGSQKYNSSSQPYVTPVSN